MTQPPRREPDSEGSPTHRLPLVDDSPPLTNVAWTSEVVSQALEAIFVYLAGGSAHNVHPIHAATLRVGWRADRQPADIIVEATRRYDLEPILVHSTSWRFEESRVVLTYVVVIDAPSGELNVHLADELVARADLARGDAMGPPPSIDVGQVVEHAFRHLSWLVKDDVAVHDALPDWVAFLDAYEPEPFRAFGAPQGAGPGTTSGTEPSSG
jgi:hypothetical protein